MEPVLLPKGAKEEARESCGQQQPCPNAQHEHVYVHCASVSHPCSLGRWQSSCHDNERRQRPALLRCSDHHLSCRPASATVTHASGPKTSTEAACTGHHARNPYFSTPAGGRRAVAQPRWSRSSSIPVSAACYGTSTLPSCRCELPFYDECHL
jgi:hypothetical protein